MTKRVANPYQARRSVADRFWAKVEKGDGCWLWTGAKAESGHGNCWEKDRLQGAHRVSWTLHFGDIPAGMCVCHHCDNPPCVNPEHLFLGTQGDNTRDMVAKGRGRNPIAESERSRTHCPAGHEYATAGRTKVKPNGKTCRICRECQRIRAVARYQADPDEGARRRRENRWAAEARRSA